MKITIGEYLRKTDKHFVKYGFLAHFWGLLGKVFRSRKCLDKSVHYMDLRWDMMMAVLHKNK
jgi:hypothetical protein